MEPKTFKVTDKFSIGKRDYLIYFIVILVTSISLFASLEIYITLFKPTTNQINLAGQFALIVFVVILTSVFVTGIHNGFGKRRVFLESIYSTSGDADSNGRLKEAAQGYLSGKPDKDGFFEMIGKRTSMEENILKSLDNIKLKK